jgi:hypothetical protein
LSDDAPPACRYETGRWPSIKIRCFFPRALPWAGMSEAFGLALPELGQMSKLQCEPGRFAVRRGQR